MPLGYDVPPSHSLSFRRGRRPRRPVSRGSTYRPVGRGPRAPPPGTLSAQTARSAVIPSQCEHWRGNPSPSAALPRCRDVVPQGHLFRFAPLQDAVPYTRFNIPSRRAGPVCPAEECVPDGGTHGSRPTGAYPPKNNAAPRKGRRAFSVHVWHRRRRVIFAAFTSGNRGGKSTVEGGGLADLYLLLSLGSLAVRLPQLFPEML